MIAKYAIGELIVVVGLNRSNGIEYIKELEFVPLTENNDVILKRGKQGSALVQRHCANDLKVVSCAKLLEHARQLVHNGITNIRGEVQKIPVFGATGIVGGDVRL